MPHTMQQALTLARAAGEKGEVPIAALVVERRSGKVIAAAHNLVETTSDPTAHAELLALREAAKLSGAARLTGYDLYVTLEPCAMCAAAIALARIDRLYFGAYDPKGGGVEHGARIFDQPTCNHRPEIIGGIRESECAELLQDFFKQRR